MLGLWHVPALYDAAARNEGIHLLEHTCFFAAALLYWGPLLEAPPVRARIDHLRRAGWFAAGAVPGWILAIVLAYASHPLYPYYATLGHRAFGLSPIADQQIGAGVMWVPGSPRVLRRLHRLRLSLARAEGVRHADGSRAPTRGALMDVTASFLAGSILGWAMPLGLLIAILIWWMVVLRRRCRRRRIGRNSAGRKARFPARSVQLLAFDALDERSLS